MHDDAIIAHCLHEREHRESHDDQVVIAGLLRLACEICWIFQCDEVRFGKLRAWIGKVVAEGEDVLKEVEVVAGGDVDGGLLFLGDDGSWFLPGLAVA